MPLGARPGGFLYSFEALSPEAVRERRFEIRRGAVFVAGALIVDWRSGGECDYSGRPERVVGFECEETDNTVLFSFYHLNILDFVVQ